MSLVNNILLSRQGEVIFANSSAYHVELRMAGREAETTTFLAALEPVDTARLLTISAPLGAGKTFFLNTVLGRFARGAPAFDERRNCQYFLATEFNVPNDDDDGAELDVANITSATPLSSLAAVYEEAFAGVAEPYVLIVEELDRKATLGQVLWSIAGGIHWLTLGCGRLLVLTGDSTIGHRRVQQLVEHVQTRSHIDLEPLDAGLLVAALEARILDKLIEPIASDLAEAERLAAARKAAELVVGDEFVRWAVLPKTASVEVATFRDALGALRQMSVLAPALEGDVRFDRELVRALRQDAIAPGGPAATLEQALVDDVKKRISASQVLSPMSVAQLADLAGAEATPRFRRRAVDALARLGLLTPLGVPFEEVDDRGALVSLAEPFVPSYRLLHRSLAEMVAEDG